MPIISKRKDKKETTGELISPVVLKEKKKMDKKRDSENPLLSEPPPRLLKMFEFTKELNRDRVYDDETIGSIVLFDSNNGQESTNSANKKQDLLFKKLRNER